MSASRQIWVPQISGTKKSLKSIAWTGTQLVASGYSASQGGVFVASRDRISWRTVNENESAAAFSLVWAGDKLVGAGAAAWRGCIMLSENIDEWTYIQLRQREPLTSLIWTGDRLFTGGGDGWLMSSIDGGHWENVGFVPINMGSIAFTGKLLVVASGGIQTSTSGRSESWTSQKLDGRYISGAEYVSWTGKKLLAVGRSGLIISSSDGLSWTRHDSGCKHDLNSAIWTGMQFVVVGYKGVILTSSDGANWAAQESGTEETLLSVVKADGRLAAVGDSGTVLVSEMTATEKAEDERQQALADAEQKRRREGERQAEEARKLKLQSSRAAAGVCILCGKPLGVLQKLTRAKQHKECSVYTE
jgi:hypothetical protein